MNNSGEKPKRIVAKPVRQSVSKEVSNREIWASICYYYPQYTLKEASLLSKRDIALLLRVAQRLEAVKMRNLVQIVSAPHTKKGSGVKQLLNYFQQEIDK